MEQENKPVRVPSPKKKPVRASALSRLFFSWVVYSILVLAIAVPIGIYAYSQYIAPGPLRQNKIVMINPGSRTADIGELLRNQNIIQNTAVFNSAAYLKAAMGINIKPGEYEIFQSSSIEQVLNTLSSGQLLKYKVTIPEGWTSSMAFDRVNQNDVLVGEVVTIPPEGSILPETYVFQRGMTRAKLLEDMQTAHNKMLDELWAKRNPNTILQDKQQAVILASIVEKETGVAEERPLVASVFVNRLKQNMRLQSDPTTIYGITGGKAKLDRGLTKDDLTADTPYNTYRINGLPAGPIANPGRAAIEAVLNPPDTAYLYFVANGTGGHAFAATLDEHNTNVAKWRATQAGQAAVVTTPAANTVPADGMPVPGPVSPSATVPAAVAPAATVNTPATQPLGTSASQIPAPPPALPSTATKPGTTASPIPQALPPGAVVAKPAPPASTPATTPPEPAETPTPADTTPAMATDAPATVPPPDQAAKPAATTPTAPPIPTPKPTTKPQQAAEPPTAQTPDQPTDPEGAPPKPGSPATGANQPIPIPRLKPKSAP